MQLPGFKDASTQLTLWDEPLGGHGHVRTVIGDFSEQLTVKFLKGRRYRTDCTADYCPDIFACDLFLEVKAAGRSNQTFVYAGRLQRDLEFSLDHPLYYAIWHHGADTKQVHSVYALRCQFLATLRTLYLVPFAEIYAIAQTIKPTSLNSKYGHSDTNPIYGMGYRLPLALIRKRQHLPIHFKASKELF
jgi:hypothetical protein